MQLASTSQLASSSLMCSQSSGRLSCSVMCRRVHSQNPVLAKEAHLRNGLELKSKQVAKVKAGRVPT